jgi:cysteine desulfurase
MRRVYLDWNATTPPLPAALDAMRAAHESAWGNPSSIHGHGRVARARVEDARAQVAELLGAEARDVVFTSGGTEANNLGLRSYFAAKTGTLVLSALEHPSVLRVAEALEREGRAQLRWLKIRSDGTIDMEDLETALTSGSPVVLVTLQTMNHETGVLQPVDEVIATAHARGAAVHVDAVQSTGKLERLGAMAESRAVAAHKLRGPKGIGALVTRPGLGIEPVLRGGSQERGIRPGTVDAALASGFGVAAAHALSGPARYASLRPQRDAFETALLRLCPSAQVLGAAPRAPHVTALSFPGWAGAELVAALDLEGVSVSSGSACSAGTIEPSAAVAAMCGAEVAKGALRISMGDETTEDDLAFALAGFGRVLGRGAG